MKLGAQGRVRRAPDGGALDRSRRACKSAYPAGGGELEPI